MCGIAGVYSSIGVEPEREVLSAMAAAIAHRGPDGEGFFVEGGCGFAHRHLRIIDLTDAARQPMQNEDGSLHLIFNGEIYNYVELWPVLEAAGHIFHSHCDAETVLHAYEQWGVECLSRFNGMFAFALYDSRKKQLFMARDRVGVKPLYYRWDGTTLVFASEIKAILAYPGVEVAPNMAAITEYMHAMYTTGEHTWFEGIKRLLPGHFMLVDPEGLHIEQWWDVPSKADAPRERPERYYVQKTRALLEDSVRLRLRADVPLGAHLSGGIDSSSVVALLSRQLRKFGEPVRTFSGAFEEGPAYDERPYIEMVAAKYSTDHHEAIPTSDDLPHLLERMVWHMDEPAAGPGILLQWAVCEATRRAGVTVINGGQGGDEAWGGYMGYVPAYFKSLLRQARRRPRLLFEIARSAGVLLTRPTTRKAMLKALANGRRSRLAASTQLGVWAGSGFKRLAARSKNGARHGDDKSAANRDPLSQAMYNDLKWYLPALLHVEDRTSMAFALESRAPLLDYRIIEHSVAVPGVLKLKGLDLKHVLKQAVKGLLPPAIYRRTDKMGMPTPVDVWFRGPLAHWVRQQLDSPEAQALGLFDRDYVLAALEEHQSGKRDRSLDLWKMLNVITWWRLFVTRTASPPTEAPITTSFTARAEPGPLETATVASAASA